MVKYNKLVRDGIPAIVHAQGKKTVIHTADHDEYRRKLLEKLQEEVHEFIQVQNSEELADIFEVLHALAHVHDISFVDVEKIRTKKAKDRGTFEKRIILDEVDE